MRLTAPSHGARASIVTTLDADNLLEPQTLARVVNEFQQHPGAAAIYGAVQLIDDAGSPLRRLTPAAFDREAVMRCELVPPFSTAFFSRHVCGGELTCDPSLATCADYDLWLRLSQLEIVSTGAVLGRTRLSGNSMTRDPSHYDAFCRDKLSALRRHLDHRSSADSERAQAIAGIYCWAAESVLELEGPGPRFESFAERAAELCPGSTRLQRVRDQASTTVVQRPARASRAMRPAPSSTGEAVRARDGHVL